MQRSDIILAAAQLFREKGYHGTSMQDIADAVHLQKASLYHHVSSKQDILVSLLDQALELLIEDITEVVDSDLPPEEKLRNGMRAYISRLAEESGLATVLLIEHRSLDEELRAEHIAHRDRYERLWRRIIQEGINKGSFHEVDVPVTTFALLGVQNWIITWYRPDGRFEPDEIADQYCALFLEGLLLRSKGTKT